MKKLVCCVLLLALVGTTTGAGLIAAEQAGFAVQVKNAGNGGSDWEQDCQTCQDNAYAYCNAMWGSSYLLTPFYDICVAFNRLPCLIGHCHPLETSR
jgi:hypothetical protein